jgi:hypothetical protein
MFDGLALCGLFSVLFTYANFLLSQRFSRQVCHDSAAISDRNSDASKPRAGNH